MNTDFENCACPCMYLEEPCHAWSDQYVRLNNLFWNENTTTYWMNNRERTKYHILESYNNNDKES